MLSKAYAGRGGCLGKPLILAGPIGFALAPLFAYTAGDSLASATYSRTSAATYTDSLGVVRFAPHNLLLWSELLTNGSWSVVDGATRTATTVTLTSGTTARLEQQLVPVIGATYTISVQMSVASGSKSVHFGQHTGGWAAVSGSTVTVTTTPQWFSHTFVASAAIHYIRLGGSVSTANPEAVTMTVSGVQAERNTAASTYLVTTTAARYDSARDSHYIGGVRTLLLEGQRTNLLLHNTDSANAAWTKGSSTITSNTTVAPDGTTTADTLTTTAAFGNVNQTVTKAASSLVYTSSTYAKPGTSNIVRMVFGDTSSFANGAFVEFNAATGVISTPATTFGAGFSGVSGRITLAEQGYYRCELTVTSNTVATIVATFGTPVSGFSVITWGMQLEQAASASSHIPTTSATVTRAADSLSFAPSFAMQPCTVYVRRYELGTVGVSNGAVFQLGDAGATAMLDEFVSGGTLIGRSIMTAGTVSSAHVANPAYGELVESRIVLGATGSIQSHMSRNGAAEASGTVSGANAINVASGAMVLGVNNSRTGTLQGFSAFRSVHIFPGTKTLAECRALVP